MPADSAHTALERVLAVTGQCLDRQNAESVLRLRDEYEAMIRVGSFVAILQAKARRLLAEGRAA